MTRPFDLLIFDWDGTLMDSQARIVSSFHYATQKTNMPSLQDEHIRQMIGLSLDNAMYHLFPDLDTAQCEQLVLAYREHYFSDEVLPSQLYINAADTVQQLAKQGYQLAVATGKSRRGLDESLKESGLKAYFSVTRTAEETESKPHPKMLEEILWETDMPVERALMIGDTDYDLLMANHANIAGLGVTYGMHSRERLAACQPAGLIDAINALTGWLAARE